MIKDLIIGKSATISLVVKSVSLRYTKSKKPFLSLELTDGIDGISATMWDYYADELPAKSSILRIEATVIEYNGAKQLTITYFETDDKASLASFAPQGPMSTENYMMRAATLIGKVNNDEARYLVENVFLILKSLWDLIPGAKSIHHAYIAGTLKHSVDTAEKALALSNVTPGCSDDLCIVGGLLHDLGKLWSYELQGVVIDYTEIGNLLGHIPLGIAKIEQFRTDANTKIVDLVQHIIASHHGQLEWGSPITPRFLEAWYVFLADMADAKSETIRALNNSATGTYTEKEWSMGNVPLFTQAFISKIMDGNE